MIAPGVRKNKYGNRKTEYNGRTYDSAKEATYARALTALKRDGYVDYWEPQYRIKIEVNGKHVCTYVADFYVVYADNRVEVVDVKGVETAVFKLKKKLLEATYFLEHPEITFRIVK